MKVRGDFLGPATQHRQNNSDNQSKHKKSAPKPGMHLNINSKLNVIRGRLVRTKIYWQDKD